MKINLTIVMIAALIATACDREPKGDVATITSEQKAEGQGGGEIFYADTAESKIRFTGYGVGKQHPGNFKISSGSVKVTGNQLSGGEFVINIKSLDVEQRDKIFQEKLKPHLLSGDFFDADKFSTSRFEITAVEPYKPDAKDTSIVDGANFNISGNLTIRDVTKNITFPARVDLDDNTLKGKADFNIDRTQWKINYGNDKTLGDKFISEKVNVELDLKATRK